MIEAAGMRMRVPQVTIVADDRIDVPTVRGR